ncbi:MAG: ADP-ribosylglycohydrolase family protein [Bacilli bacterium]|nr:ADP-ribosylglycohydrolase family protein [Bacilli bacterium]MDD4733551.1 ADP-ribosylglycohydrolase family protein [Bacilli bacterium]
MRVKDGIIGFAVGDAMGVPTEFHKREDLLKKPVTKMIENRFEGLPKGSWSDDTSMVVATIYALMENGLNYNKIADNFIKWVNGDDFCSYNKCFGIGRTTLKALAMYNRGMFKAEECGGKAFEDNGNGSLMRILPIGYYCHYNRINESETIDIVSKVSSITHGNEISILGCYLYVKYLSYILDKDSKEEAYKKLKLLDLSYFSDDSIIRYKRILKEDISDLYLDDIKSSGYVVDTLEASLWCFLKSDNFRDCIVAAINLGEDTDTIAGIAGGLAGIYYGYETIPLNWLRDLVKLDYLVLTSNKFEDFLKVEDV